MRLLFVNIKKIIGLMFYQIWFSCSALLNVISAWCFRLCSDPSVAAQVVDLQGINRLVRLCKEERERNHSDGVLVACLVCITRLI